MGLVNFVWHLVFHAVSSMPCALVYDSLVPRPFPLPFYDCLQYAKTEGKAWEKESRA